MRDDRATINDPGGICVGALPDGRLLVDRAEMHIRVTGPTGSGKTASFFLPTLMRTWRGSSIVHDRKGDFWLFLQSSSSWRHNILFAPSEATTARYNPMARVGVSTSEQIAGFQNLAALLPHNAGTPVKEPIWDENSKALATAQMLFLMNFGDPKDRNLGGLRDFHASGMEGGLRMMAQEHPDPVIRAEIANSAKKIWENENERYVGSILATIDSYLNVYADPNVRDAVSTCEFAPADLVCGEYPTLLNLFLPPNHSERLSPLVRMLTSQLLNTFMAHQDKVGENWKRHHMLFALDEFNRFGKVDAIEGALADMRSYNCRVMLGAQSDAVLEDIYGEKSLIFNNTRLVALRPFAYDEAVALSKRIGEVEVTSEADNASYGGVGERRGGGLSRSRKRVTIMPPEKVLTMSESDVLVCNYTKPIKVQRPKLEVWRSLVNPVPYSWKPLDCELLPVRSPDGRLLDQPQAVGDRNPWDAVRHAEPPPKPPAPKEAEAKKKTVTAKLKGEMGDKLATKGKKAKTAAAGALAEPVPASGDLFDPFDDSPMVMVKEEDNAPPADDGDLFT